MYVFCRDSEYPKIQNLHILNLQLFKKSSLISHHYSDLVLNQHISFPKGFLEGLSCFFISLLRSLSVHTRGGGFLERFDSFCSLAAARLYLKCAIVLLHLPDVCSWRMLHFCLYFKIFLLREYLLTVGVDRLIDFQKLFAVTF